MPAVTNVSYVGASQEALAEGSWTMTFTVEATLSGGGRLFIAFDDAFDLSGVATSPSTWPDAVAGLTFGGDFDPTTFAYISAIVDNVIDLTLWSATGGTLLAGGGTGTITITPITNPGIGVYTAANFSITTTGNATAGSPAGDITIVGSASAPTASTSQPSDVTADSMTVKGVVSSNGAATTVLFRYGTDPTLTTGTSTVAAAQSPLADDASAAAVSAPLTSLSNETLYVRVEATNSEGTTNGSIIAVAPVGNRYWVGGTGNWSDGANWSATSGGTGGDGPPTRTVNAIFDANSFDGEGQTVTFDVAAIAFLSMDWTGATGTPELACGAGTVQVRCYGSLTFIEDMTVTGTLNEADGWTWDFLPPLATGTPRAIRWNPAGHTIPVLNENPITTKGMRMVGQGGSLTLDGPLVQQVGRKGTHLYMRSGTFDANGHDIEIRTIFDSDAVGSDAISVDLSGITLTLHDYLVLNNPRTTLNVSGLNLITDPDPDYCVVSFPNDTEIASWYAGAGYPGSGYEGFYLGGALVVDGPMTLEGGGTYTTEEVISQDAALTVESLSVDGGDADNRASLTGPLIASAGISADWLTLEDCPLSGVTPGYAGANSIDNGGNTGWTFSDPPVATRSITATINGTGRITATVGG